jgi:hypothetical protein
MPSTRSFSVVLGASPVLLSFSFGCGASAPAFDESTFPMLPTPDDDCATVVTRIEHADEPTPLGFSALDVLSRLAGSQSSPLYWRSAPQNQEYLLTYGSEQGRSTLELDLRQAEGPILHRFRTPLLGAPADTACDAGALQIPVIVTLESASQGLAESFDALLEAREPYRAHLSKSLEPGALRGSLGLAHVVSLDPERSFWLGPIQLEADVWQGGSVGSLSVHVGARHAKESKALRGPPSDPEQPGPLAAWPSLASCEGSAMLLPTSAKVLGFSVDDVLEQLRAGGPPQLTWSDGSVTAVRLELGGEEPELCQEVEDGLRFSAMLRARSEDGSFEVRLPVRIDASGAGGAVGDIRVEGADPDAPYVIEGSALRSRFEAEGYRAVLVGLEWSIVGGRDTGWLSLRGIDATQPSGDGTYPSTELTSVRW